MAAHFLYAHKYGFGWAFVDIRLKGIATSGWLPTSLHVSFFPDVGRHTLQLTCLVFVYKYVYIVIVEFWDLNSCIPIKVNRLPGDSINSMHMTTAWAAEKNSLSTSSHTVTSLGLPCRKKLESYVFGDFFNTSEIKISLFLYLRILFVPHSKHTPSLL